MKRWVGTITGPYKSHFIVLSPINQLKNFNQDSGILSLKGLMMSRPQGLPPLPGTLPCLSYLVPSLWPSYHS